MPTDDPDLADEDPAALAAAVLAEEAERQEAQAARSAVTVLPDDLLPGVGAEPMPMRETLRAGGASMVLVLALITVAEQFERAAGGVLAPDIQDTLHMSDTTLIGISAFGGVALVLGAVPLAWLADRMSRVRIVWIATIGWAVATALNGLVVNPFQLFCTRIGIGFGQAYSVPVFASLLTDTYPIQGRAARVQPVLAVAADRLVDRSVPRGCDRRRRGRLPRAGARRTSSSPRCRCCSRSSRSALLREPAARPLRAGAGARRGARAVVGRAPSSRYRCRRRTSGSKKIKTFYFICVGIGVLGFALVAVPVQIGLLLDDSYGYGAYTRGWMLSLTAIASLAAIPIAGLTYDRQFRRNPELVVRLAGMFVIAYGLLLFVAMRMHAIALLLVVRRARGRVHERRVRERRPDRRRGGALPDAHAGVRARAGVHLPGRRLLRRHPRRCAVRRPRRAHRVDDRRDRSPASSAAGCSCTARGSSSATSRWRSRS